MRLIGLLAALTFVLSGPVSAQPAGLIVGISDYAAVPDVNRGDRVARAVDPLTDAGMEIAFLENPDRAALLSALEQFGQQSAQSEIALIVLSGRFLNTATETYFLPSDADTGPLATLHARTLPLSTVFALLADKPGKALLVLATDDREATFDRNVALGIGTLDIPQGVTVIVGDPTRTTDLLEDHVAEPGRPFIGAARQGRVDVLGYAPDILVFLDGRAPPPQDASNRLNDIRDWRAARDTNTADAYQGYLDAHPDGEFVDMAENRLRALTDTPEARAERGEQALDLNRSARQDIQRDLSLLGFNTRGIDGIFGPGTRGAIGNWQRDQNFEQTGFLTREQIALLDEQAQRRADELQAEAEERRKQQMEADIAYWNQTGSPGDEAGLRAYLERFPDGEFAELANERLAAIEEQKRTQADRIDRDLWEQATASDTAQAYEEYLVDSPDGAFREEAQARIVALQREAEYSEAASAEAAMNMSSGTRRVIEARLNGLGLRPGPVDGVFDEDTRRAIRRYQSARNLPPSGYVSDAMMVQLMADTVRQIFR